MQRKLAAWGALVVVLAGVGLAVRGTGKAPAVPPRPVTVSASSKAVPLPLSGPRRAPDGPVRLASDHGVLEAGFSSTGAVELWAHGGHAVRVSVEGFGRGGTVRPGAPAGADFVRDEASGRVAREGNGLREWWVARPEGLEQGFDVASAPPGAGPLSVWLALDVPASVDGDGRGAQLRTVMGEVAYAGLVATDARGRALPARMERWTKGLALRVEDRGAVYPVRIDPVFTAVAQNTLAPATSAEFGLALAIVGDVDGDGCDDVATSAADLATAYIYRGCAALSDGGQGLATTPFATLTGAGGNASRVFPAGDLDGDGRADVVVASPAANGNAGVLDVWLGGATGMTSGGAGFNRTGNPGDELGFDLSPVGDINLDGFPDVVVGAPGFNGVGRVQLLLGGNSGWQDSDTWDGPAAGSRFGQSVSGAGDVNGDGTPDLLVGAPLHQTQAGTTGSASLFYGVGLTFSANASWMLESSQADSELGSVVARAGDVDGDGYADFVVGERLFDADGVNNRGRWLLVRGSELGPVLLGGFTGSQDDDQLGTRLGSAGDLNGDGFGDLVAHVPNASANAGDILAYYGSAAQKLTSAPIKIVGAAGARIGRSPVVRGDVTGDGLADVLYGNPTYSRITSWPGLAGAVGDGGTVLQAGGAANAALGTSVAGVGDVDGDGYPDLVVGAPSRTSDGMSERGEALLYNGSAAGLVVPAAWSAAGSEAGAHFGGTVAAAGDVNRDGFDDVLVASPDTDSGPVSDVGRVDLYLGVLGGLDFTAAWSFTGAQAGEHLGESLAGLGDVNGDGFADVALGAPQYDGAAGTDSGRVYVFYGRGTGAPLSATPDVVFEGLTALGHYGRGLSGGDVNGDGLGDLLVGIPRALNGQGWVQAIRGDEAGLRDGGCIWSRAGLTGDRAGESVKSAGDVDGDGREDVLVGAPGTGKVSLYLGGAAGPSSVATWTYHPYALDAGTVRVASAGDLNGDGLADVALGLPDTSCDAGTQCGSVELFLAPFSSQPTVPSATLKGTQARASFGGAVASVGDVTGDGYGDFLLGAPGFDTATLPDAGMVALHHGNSVDVAGPGVSLGARLLQPGTNTTKVPAGGRSTSDSAVDVAFLTARSPLGRVRAQIEVEVKPVGTAFNGQGTVPSPPSSNWTLLEGAGTELKVSVTGLQQGASYRWRARLRYHPNDVVAQSRGRWVYGQGGVVGAAHFRTDKPQGTACSRALDCTSGHCVEGVCCDGACNGGCDVCTAALGASTDGACTVLAPGSAGTCSPYLCGGDAACPTACTQDAECASGNYCGGGVCTAKKSTGQACSGDNQCANGKPCVDGVCCDTACGGGSSSDCQVCSASKGASSDGTCTVLAAGSINSTCGLYLCGGSASCPTSCNDNGQCVSGSACLNNACTPTLAIGQACSGDNQCANGKPCVDGVCCENACGGGCDVCSAALGASANGTCTVLARGNEGTCSPYLCRGGTDSSCPTTCTLDSDCKAGNYCSGAGACLPKKAVGQSCTAGNQCTSTFCADGVCCDSACSGGCDACAPSVANPNIVTGTCTTLASGQVGTCSPYLCGGSAACPTTCAQDAQCASGNYCNAGTCTAKKAEGQACSGDNQCANGKPCVEGVCCENACGGGCDVCAPSVANPNVVSGTCTTLASGQVGTCSPYLCGGSAACPTTCTQDAQCASGNYCNDASACVPKKAVGQACSGDNQCANGKPCADGVCCDGACTGGCDVCAAVLGASANGACTVLPVGSPGSCGAYLCQGQAGCPSACTSGGQCATGFCSDGVCCDTPCGGGITSDCQACSRAAGATADGTCAVLTSHTCRPVAGACDVAEQCTGQSSDCPPDGFASGTACADAECVDGFFRPALTCSGAEANCPTALPVSCNGYACEGSACRTQCSSHLECAAGFRCTGTGECAPKLATGATCQSPDECTTGFCVDGFCCGSQCAGQCEACDVPGQQGQCRPVTGAPRGGRPACVGTGEVCGGACNGVVVNACTYPGAAVTCRAPSCTSGVATLAAACDGAGRCPEQTQGCGLQPCAGDACSAGCAVDAECEAGNFCAGGVCRSKFVQGAACAVSSQCATGACVDGFCCDRACSGQCEACDIPGSVGRCTPVMTGQPHGARTACAGTGTCQGACDGTSPTACGYPGSAVACAPAKCEVGQVLGPSSCNGTGVCAPPEPVSCGAYACLGDACATACTTDAECNYGNMCKDGACVKYAPKPQPKPEDPASCSHAGGAAARTWLAGLVLLWARRRTRG